MLETGNHELTILLDALDVDGQAFVGLGDPAHLPLHLLVAVQLDLLLHLAHQRLDLFELVAHIAEILLLLQLQPVQVTVLAGHFASAVLDGFVGPGCALGPRLLPQHFVDLLLGLYHRLVLLVCRLLGYLMVESFL